MNRTELVDYLYSCKNTPFESKAHADRCLHAFLEAIKYGVKKHGNVQLIGFGSWTVKNRKARTGINPRTGEPITIKATRTVGFRPSRDWKHSL